MSPVRRAWLRCARPAAVGAVVEPRAQPRATDNPWPHLRARDRDESADISRRVDGLEPPRHRPALAAVMTSTISASGAGKPGLRRDQSGAARTPARQPTSAPSYFAAAPSEPPVPWFLYGAFTMNVVRTLDGVRTASRPALPGRPCLACSAARGDQDSSSLQPTAIEVGHRVIDRVEGIRGGVEGDFSLCRQRHQVDQVVVGAY